MIKINTIKESMIDNKASWGTVIHIEGDAEICTQQLISVFNGIYSKSHELFEAALVGCKYTEDHT